MAALVMDGPRLGRESVPLGARVGLGLGGRGRLSHCPAGSRRRPGGSVASSRRLLGDAAGRDRPEQAEGGCGQRRPPLRLRDGRRRVGGLRRSQERAGVARFRRARRSAWIEPTSIENERAEFKRWALSEQGIVDNITMPVLFINGKHDHLAPIGNIYFMLEHGPATARRPASTPMPGIAPSSTTAGHRRSALAGRQADSLTSSLGKRLKVGYVYGLISAFCFGAGAVLFPDRPAVAPPRRRALAVESDQCRDVRRPGRLQRRGRPGTATVSSR